MDIKLIPFWIFILIAPLLGSFLLCYLALSVVNSGQIPQRERLGLAWLYTMASLAVNVVSVVILMFRPAFFESVVNGLRIFAVWYVSSRSLKLKSRDIVLAVLIVGVLDSSWVSSYWIDWLGKHVATWLNSL